MKKIIAVLCVTAALAGCGKVEQASKTESNPVVKGGAVKVAEVQVQPSSGAGGYSENFMPTDAAHKEAATEKTTFEKFIVGKRTGGSEIPRSTSIPKPVKPPSRNHSSSAESSEPTSYESGEPERLPERITYSGVLGDIFKTGNVPEHGSAATNNREDDEFFIYDLDGDGYQELVFICSSEAEDRLAVVYGVDEEGRLFEKLSGNGAMTFYENGIIAVEQTEADCPCGSFVPYTLYRYDSNAERYVAEAEIEAYDRAEVERLAEEAVSAGLEPEYSYPSEADISGSGMVYFINTSGAGENAVPVDAGEYNEWLSGVMRGSSEAVPDIKKLNEDNIRELTRQ